MNGAETRLARLNGWNVEARPLPLNLMALDEPVFRRDAFRLAPPLRFEEFEEIEIFENRLVSPLAAIDLRQKTPWRIGDSKRQADSSFATGLAHIAAGIWFIGDNAENYFHWMTEDFVRAARAHARSPLAPLIVPRSLLRKSYVHQSLLALGAPLWVLNPRTRVKVQHLLRVESDIAAGNYRSEDLVGAAEVLARNLTSSNLAGAPAPAKTKPKNRYWISREKARQRRIIKERELFAILADFNIEVIRSEELTLTAQVEVAQSAAFLGGLHGAGLVNQMFMPGGGKLLEIRTPNDLRNNCFFSLSASFGHQYYYLMADTRFGFDRNESVRLSPDILSKTLETVFSIA